MCMAASGGFSIEAEAAVSTPGQRAHDGSLASQDCSLMQSIGERKVSTSAT